MTTDENIYRWSLLRAGLKARLSTLSNSSVAYPSRTLIYRHLVRTRNGVVEMYEYHTPEGVVWGPQIVHSDGSS